MRMRPAPPSPSIDMRPVPPLDRVRFNASCESASYQPTAVHDAGAELAGDPDRRRLDAPAGRHRPPGSDCSARDPTGYDDRRLVLVLEAGHSPAAGARGDGRARDARTAGLWDNDTAL